MRFLLYALAALVVALYCGCEATGSGQRQGVIDDATWPFWPGEMRIHPLTRVMSGSENNGVIIEVRVEFTDTFGHTTKAVGAMEAELVDQSTAPPNVVNHWEVALNDLSVNQSHFDDVTRTYLLRLRTDAEALPEQAELRVQFNAVDGQVFTAGHPLKNR